MTVPEKMKVAYYYDNNNVKVEVEPVPNPGPGEILVQTKACGVCVADTMEWYLTNRAPLPLVMNLQELFQKLVKALKNSGG